MTRLYRHATLAEGQAGIEGQPAAGADITTAGALNNASTVTPFGRGVIVSGAVDDLPVIDLPSAASNVIFGVTLYSFSYERTADTTDADGFFGYPIKGTTTIATRGLIFVVPENTGTINSDVFVRHTVNGAPGTHEAIGRFRTNIDTDKGIQLLNARWLTAPIAGQVCKLELNVP
jgi:hypothetical protein